MERRLAAILAADVVGYSRLMGQDEAGTLQALKAIKTEVIDPKIADHKGRIFKTTGDGVLAEFPSVVSAVACAAEIQMAVQQRAHTTSNSIPFRIGIHVGDCIAEGDDLFGDGVNVAARLEGIAPPHGIAVSAVVREHIGNRLDLSFEDMGEQELKNIDRPIKVYRISIGDGAGSGPPKLELPGKPSIAVLPFLNMTTDPEQETFADGLTEDLITDLSRNEGIFVIARNSSFAYKGKSVDVRRIAKDLGVRYLLEGSARRAANRVRINVQLIDAIGGGHVWGERFDRSLEDVFAVQDEVTKRIVEALSGRLTTPPPRKRPSNLQAYDLCVQGRAIIDKSAGLLKGTNEACILLRRAIAHDPAYSEAHRWLAFGLWAIWTSCAGAMQPSRSDSLKVAEKAVQLDENDAGARSVLGLVYAFERRWAECDEQFAKALSLDPNNAETLIRLTELSAYAGHGEIAIEQAERALRLNPLPPGGYYWELGLAQYAARRHEEAVDTLRHESTYRRGSRRILAAALAQLGRIEEAQQEAALFLANTPRFSIRDWIDIQPFRDESVRQHFMDGYRKAGLPE